MSAKSSSDPKTFLELAIEPLLQNQDEASVYFIRLCKNLTWSHFVELIRIADTTERQFYEVETLQNKWSVREMKRQIDSRLFTRVGLSKDKEKVLEMAKTGQVVESPQDIIKDPFVFEFLSSSRRGNTIISLNFSHSFVISLLVSTVSIMVAQEVIR